MKKNLLFILFFFSFQLLFSQSDSTQAVFKNAKYSYAQFDLGYIGMPYKDIFLNGFTWHFGVVLNNQFNMGIGVDILSGKNIPYPQFPKNSSATFSITNGSLDLEYLFKPNKLINFSFPAKIIWAQTSYSNVIFDSVIIIPSPGLPAGDYNDNFLVLQPGATIFLNLFKGMSLGVGGNYRFAMNVKKVGTNADFSGYSIQAFLRFKFWSREWYQKQMEKQQEMMRKIYGAQNQKKVI